MELCPDPKFQGIPLNFAMLLSSMEFHGIPCNFEFSRKKRSMEFHGTFCKFHGIPYNSTELDKFDVFLNIDFGI